jgi:hypothetical protein
MVINYMIDSCDNTLKNKYMFRDSSETAVSLTARRAVLLRGQQLEESGPQCLAS